VAVALKRMQNLATFLAPYHLDRHSTAEGLGLWQSKFSGMVLTMGRDMRGCPGLAAEGTAWLPKRMVEGDWPLLVRNFVDLMDGLCADLDDIRAGCSFVTQVRKTPSWLRRWANFSLF
jgi:hypothetical protein